MARLSAQLADSETAKSELAEEKARIKAHHQALVEEKAQLQRKVRMQ